MSTDLILIDGKNATREELNSEYPIFDPSSDLAEALMCNSDGDFELGDLTRIKTPSGGSTMWVYEDFEGEKSSKSIDGLLVYWHSQITLWPYDQPTGSSRPYIISYDGKIGHITGDNPGDLDESLIDEARNEDGSIDMAKLYYNQMGSALKGSGRRAKHQIRLFLLPPDRHLPVIVTAQPGSVWGIKKTLRNLSPACYRCMVSLTLVQETNRAGQPYSRIELHKTGEVSKDAGQVIRASYYRPLAEAVSQQAASDGTGSDFDE
jgi:hypothetical protein